MSEPIDLLNEIKRRADLGLPKPWGEHDLMLEVDWYKRTAIPFLLKQYEDLLTYCESQCKQIHDEGCERDKLQSQNARLVKVLKDTVELCEQLLENNAPPPKPNVIGKAKALLDEVKSAKASAASS